MPTSPYFASQSRRRFLNTVGAGSVATVLASSMASRLLATDAKSAFRTSADSSTEIIFMSATKLAELIRTKKVSAVEAVKAYTARIEAVNSKINAVVAKCYERAMDEAKLADEALAKGEIKGPLHGVPFTIKDSLETSGVVSTAGTLGRKSFIPGNDATVVARVRAAGAILLGKTNTPEFTLAGGSRGTFNLVYGQTYNPYKPHFNPSGSSGGAGAIVASGGSAFDIGSDFGGSIRGPSHVNGITGIKPTTGRVPRTGHLPGYGGAFDAYQELGPLARRVEDLMLIVPILAGPDFEDPVAMPIPLADPGSVDLKSLRVAFYTDNKVSPATAETVTAVKTAAQALQGLVASIAEDFHGGDPEGTDIRTAYVGADGGAWFQRLLDRNGTKQASPGLARRITGKSITADQFTLLAEKQDALRSRLLSWLDKYDVILCPVMPTPATLVDETDSVAAATAPNYTSIYNITGWPAAVVRAGVSPEGLPIGIQVVAKPWREDVALAVAQAIESKTGGWQKPPI